MNKIMRFASMLLLFLTWNTFAIQDGQVPPTPEGRVPTPPGLPIDDYVIVLFIIGLFFGAYKAYQIVKRRQALRS